MYPLLVKADMSQVPIGWSKAVVSQDMDPMQVTADVTHLPIVRPKAMLWRLGSHAGHGRSAPMAERLVGGFGFEEHGTHIGHGRGVPIATEPMNCSGSPAESDPAHV